MEIPGDADLADYGEKLLELAGLSRIYYRWTDWNGTENLIVGWGGDVQNADCRQSKLIRNVKSKIWKSDPNTGSGKESRYWNLWRKFFQKRKIRQKTHPRQRS